MDKMAIKCPLCLTSDRQNTRQHLCCPGVPFQRTLSNSFTINIWLFSTGCSPHTAGALIVALEQTVCHCCIIRSVRQADRRSEPTGKFGLGWVGCHQVQIYHYVQEITWKSNVCFYHPRLACLSYVITCRIPCGVSHLPPVLFAMQGSHVWHESRSAGTWVFV